MNTVPPPKGQHLSRVTADDIAFYYSKGCKLFPPMYKLYFELLSDLEHQGRVCLTPTATLERYHLQLQKRIEERIRKIARRIAR